MFVQKRREEKLRLLCTFLLLLLYTGNVVAEGKPGSLGCSRGDSVATPPFLLDVGGVVPKGYLRLFDLEGEGQETLHCFTKDAGGKICWKLEICLWDGGGRDDDGVTSGAGATYERSGRGWIGGADPGTGDTDPMDIMWRYLSVVSG